MAVIGPINDMLVQVSHFPPDSALLVCSRGVKCQIIRLRNFVLRLNEWFYLYVLCLALSISVRYHNIYSLTSKTPKTRINSSLIWAAGVVAQSSHMDSTE